MLETINGVLLGMTLVVLGFFVAYLKTGVNTDAAEFTMFMLKFGSILWGMVFCFRIGYIISQM